MLISRCLCGLAGVLGACESRQVNVMCAFLSTSPQHGVATCCSIASTPYVLYLIATEMYAVGLRLRDAAQTLSSRIPRTGVIRNKWYACKYCRLCYHLCNAALPNAEA